MNGAAQAAERLSRSDSCHAASLKIQIAQSKCYLYTLGPKVGILYMIGSLKVCGFPLPLQPGDQVSVSLPCEGPGNKLPRF